MPLDTAPLLTCPTESLAPQPARDSQTTPRDRAPALAFLVDSAGDTGPSLRARRGASWVALGCFMASLLSGCPSCRTGDAPGEDAGLDGGDAGSRLDAMVDEPDATVDGLDAAVDAGGASTAQIATFQATPSAAVPPFSVSLSWTLTDGGPAVVPCRVDLDDDGTFDLELDDCRSTLTASREVTALGRYSSTLELAGGDRRSVSYAGCEPPVEILSTDFDGFSDQRWEDVYAAPECTDYRVVAMAPAQKLTVLQSSSLTIDPGVRTEFEAGLALEILGSLDARGTAAEPIALFGTTQARGHWRGVLIYDPAGVSVTGAVALAHVEVAHAGGGVIGEASSPAGIAIVQARADVSITDSLVRASAGVGLLIERSPLGELVFEGNTLRENTRPARVEASFARFMDGDSTHVGNDEDVVELVHTDLSGGVHRWDGLDVPYRLLPASAGTRFEVQGDWYLEAGVELELPRDVLVEVSGSLESVGTAGSPVVFRGADPIDPAWGALWLNRDGYRMEHTELLDGGSRAFSIQGPNTPAATVYLDSALLVADHLTVADGAGFGMVLVGSAILEMTNGVLTRNRAPAHLGQNHARFLTTEDNDYSGNIDDRIHVGFWSTFESGLHRWAPLHWFVYGDILPDGSNGRDISVPTGTQWRLAPGATVDLAEGVGVQVYGGEVAGPGTSDDPLLFRRAFESGGPWGGFEVTNFSEVTFTHTTFSDGFVPSFDPIIPDALFTVGAIGGPAPMARVVLGEGLSQTGAETGILIGANTDVVGAGCMWLGFTLLHESGSCEE